MILYHGSELIIDKPQYGKGKPYNDYGLAFYCTESKELASEWAVSENRDGFVNCYDVDMSDLSVLDLCDEQYTVLNWMSILVSNRNFDSNSPMVIEGKNYLMKNYSVEYEKYDVIIGWRADDSYFSFARAFLNNTLSLEKLEQAMKLDNLGIQYAIKSEKAFSYIKYLKYEVARHNSFFQSKKQREINATEDFQKIRSAASVLNETYIIDLLRRG